MTPTRSVEAVIAEIKAVYLSIGLVESLLKERGRDDKRDQIRTLNEWRSRLIVSADSLTDLVSVLRRQQEQKAELLAVLKRIEQYDIECACDHLDDDCCAKVKGVDFCAHCYAAAAITKAKSSMRQCLRSPRAT